MRALNAAHGDYLWRLASGLPELVSLEVVGLYEGGEDELKGFGKLQELQCELGATFRCVSNVCYRTWAGTFSNNS